MYVTILIDRNKIEEAGGTSYIDGANQIRIEIPADTDDPIVRYLSNIPDCEDPILGSILATLADNAIEAYQKSKALLALIKID